MTVVRGRAEDKAIRKQVGLADVVTSRAVAPLGKLAHWSLPLAKVGGRMTAMKGESVAEELDRDAAIIAKAGAGASKIFVVGEGLLPQPTTLISIERRR